MRHIHENTGVPERELMNIPDNARTIIVKKKTTADSLYNEFYNALLTRGHRIANSDNQRLFINTEGKNIGMSTLQRMTVIVNEQSGYAVIRIQTEWMAGTQATAMASSLSGVHIDSNWEISRWSIDRSGNAFAESIAVVLSLDGISVDFAD